MRDMGSNPGSGRSPGGGHGNPLQYSCLDNPMDRESGGLQPIGLQKSQTRLKQQHAYTHQIIAEFTFTVFKIELAIGHKISITKFK